MQGKVKIFLKADFDRKKKMLQAAEDENERNEKERLKNESQL